MVERVQRCVWTCLDHRPSWVASQGLHGCSRPHGRDRSAARVQSAHGKEDGNEDAFEVLDITGYHRYEYVSVSAGLNSWSGEFASENCGRTSFPLHRTSSQVAMDDQGLAQVEDCEGNDVGLSKPMGL